MFSKVLVSDDLGSVNKGVAGDLDIVGLEHITQVQYCDDAYLRIKRAIKDRTPFDLIITDLHFKPDHRLQDFNSGEALIRQLRVENIPIKIIVYSVEDRLQKARHLINAYSVDAYVCKGRHGLSELKDAIKQVYNGERYLSPQVDQALNHKHDLEITDYDIELIRQLSAGMSQDQISDYFKMNGTSPSSLSSIEKRLNKLRIQFKANNAIHLVAIVKDLGLI